MIARLLYKLMETRVINQRLHAPSAAGEPDIYQFTVPELSEADALFLIRQEVRVRNLSTLATASTEELRPIYAAVGGNPLALRLVVGQSQWHGLDAVLTGPFHSRNRISSKSRRPIRLPKFCMIPGQPLLVRRTRK